MGWVGLRLRYVCTLIIRFLDFGAIGRNKLNGSQSLRFMRAGPGKTGPHGPYFQVCVVLACLI